MTISAAIPVIDSVREMFAYPFMVNAFAAGTVVAVMAGVLGWLMVLRRQTFAGHTLSLIAFPGASGAVLIGLPAAVGYFAFCSLGALAIGGSEAMGREARTRDAATVGTVQALGLGAGFYFASLYSGLIENVGSMLFGTFLGITRAQVLVLLAVALVSLAVVIAIWRPLVFASLDPGVARARRVPVRIVSLGFLILLGLAVAETAQITGVLLVFALLVMPAAAAQTLSARPGVSVALTIVIGLVATWGGLTAAYYTPWPVGFWVTTIAFVAFVAARVAAPLMARQRARTSTDATNRSLFERSVARVGEGA